VTGTQDPALLEALKHGARALREAGIDHAVGGGIAVWARGGPPTEHDIDFVIREADVEGALRACEQRGMRTATPPEGWLVKTWHEEVLIDLIFRPTGITVDDAFFARCETMNVAAITMPISCFLTAWRVPLRHLFPIPVGAATVGILAVLIGWWRQ